MTSLLRLRQPVGSTLGRAGLACRSSSGGNRRAFGGSRTLGLKESDRDREDAASHYESHKQDQLQHAKEHGQGKRKEELASDSEASVHADRGHQDHSKSAKQDIQDLQKNTSGKS